MWFFDCVAAVQVGDGSRYPQHTMIAARRKLKMIQGFVQPADGFRCKRACLGQHFAMSICVAVNSVMGGKPKALTAPCSPHAGRNIAGGFTKLMILQRGE